MSDLALACPCCGEPTVSELGSYEICSKCGWEDDPVQSGDERFAGGANRLSLMMAREHFRITGSKVK